jgi:hypothetical protein
MNRFDGAVITHQGVDFAIAVVQSSLLAQPRPKEQARAEFAAIFGGLPTVLMAQDARGVPTYDGRRDLVNFLASIAMERIPWQQYTLANAA